MRQQESAFDRVARNVADMPRGLAVMYVYYMCMACRAVSPKWRKLYNAQFDKEPAKAYTGRIKFNPVEEQCIPPLSPLPSGTMISWRFQMQLEQSEPSATTIEQAPLPGGFVSSPPSGIIVQFEDGATN